MTPAPGRPSVVAWTGHRPDLFSEPEAARAAVDQLARELSQAGAQRFLVGGQRGVDTWAAQAAIACNVPFSLILPLAIEEFTRDWSPEDASALHHAHAQAAEVHIAAGYSQRNEYLARNAALLVAVWTQTVGGGAAETIAYARQAGTPVREIVLAPSPTASSATGSGI